MAAALLAAVLLAPAAGIVVRQHSAGVEGLRSWEQAQEKARQVLRELTPAEKGSLVHGSKSYHPGWYVGNTQPIPRLGIPALTMQDAGNGFRPYMPGTHGSTTMWPSGLALAATWDEGIAEAVGKAMGQEFRAKGANVMLGPSVNVHRVACNGRNFEYMSGEDPYLGSRIVKPFVRGVQSEGVIATVKHYAFNEQETNRGTDGKQVASSSDVDARTAWELYYPPFSAAVEAGAGAFMCSYNRVNGTHACENEGLLRRDLKGAMGFQGFVMSDWGATHSTKAVAVGLDQDMPGGHDRFFQAAELNRTFPQETDEAVLRILSSVYRLRLDERRGCTPPACLQDMTARTKTPERLQLARQAATRSIALLKNDGLLPLDSSKVKTLAVLGAAAAAGPSREPVGVMPDYFSGGGSGHVSAQSVVTAYEGLRQRAEAAGIKVVHSAERDPARVKTLAHAADVVVIVGATTATEGTDRKTLHLDDNVDALIQAIAPLKPTAVLMQTPGAVLTPWRDSVGAVANLFLGGEESGHAWASVVFGDEPPMGKLPIMMPATAQDVVTPEAGIARYAEGLFTSYRSRTFKAAFPFGHGLSYTTFLYGAARVLADGCAGAACVRLTVANSGNRLGAELAQAYLRFPPGAGEPDLVLRGFERTRVLGPGEQQELTFVFSARDLSIYDPAAGGWLQQSGMQVLIGASSADIRQVVPL